MAISREVPVAALMLLLCSAPIGWAKVHEVLWDVPGDGLQLPSISTAKCGDTIRFRCPLHATHGLYKLEPTNYNGTCPQSFEQPMIGEPLYEPKKGCDFSIKLEEGPDFFLTSHIPGACQKNLKVYVHTVCVKTENTYASSLFNSLPALPSFGSGSQLSSAAVGRADRLARRHAAAEAGDSAALPAAGYAGVVGTLPSDIPAGLMGGANAPTLGAMRPASRMAASVGADQGVLEQAKQSSAGDVRPVLASLVLAVTAAALVL